MTRQQVKKELIALFNKLDRLMHIFLARLEARETRTADEFKEALHPRKENGQFKIKGRVFTSKNDIQSFMDEPIKQWQKQLIYDETEAIYSYTTDGFKIVNQYLRGVISKTDANKDDVDSFIKNLDNLISKFDLPDNITVYRGVDLNVLPPISNPDELKKYIGGEYVNEGYSSSSMLSNVEIVKSKPCIFEITIPKGKGNGAYINSLAGHYEDVEFEFLIRRNATFDILDIDVIGENKFFIKMELKDAGKKEM